MPSEERKMDAEQLRAKYPSGELQFHECPHCGKEIVLILYPEVEVKVRK